MVLDFGNNLFERDAIKDDSGTYLSDWKWLIDNGTRVIADASSAGVDTNVYTVPAGKIFYLTSIFMSARNEDANTKIISLTVAGKNFMVLNLSAGSTVVVANSSNPTVPIKFAAAEVFRLADDPVNNIRASVTIVGYELKA